MENIIYPSKNFLKYRFKKFSLTVGFEPTAVRLRSRNEVI
jgi:hypothetical protein